jgi:hypothetical protein
MLGESQSKLSGQRMVMNYEWSWIISSFQENMHLYMGYDKKLELAINFNGIMIINLT